MTPTVATTIAKQINALDPMAFFAWGTSDLQGYSATKEDLGALRWTVRNCRTFKGTAFVKVTLEFDDTYTVKLYKHRNYTKKMRAKVLSGDYTEADLTKVISRVKGVYVDQLIETIDTMLGEVR